MQLISMSDAYYCAETIEELATVDDIPLLKDLDVPHEQYTCARTSRAREAAIRSQNSIPSSRDHNRLHHVLSPYSYHPHDDLDHHSLPSDETTSSSDGSPSPVTTPASVHASLAPLEYLENLPRAGRHPMDDYALRLFDSVHSLQKMAPVVYL